MKKKIKKILKKYYRVRMKIQADVTDVKKGLSVTYLNSIRSSLDWGNVVVGGPTRFGTHYTFDDNIVGDDDVWTCSSIAPMFPT